MAHFQKPTTHLDRGWVVNNVVSIIDVTQQSLVHTFILDDILQGASNPWAISCSDDGNTLLITHAGTHELSIIDLQAMHQRLQNPVPGGFKQTLTEVL